MHKIILASSSPRRKELLLKHGYNFDIDVESIEEVLDENLTLPSRLKKLAYNKGIKVALRHPEDLVLSADTMVCLGEELLGKAKDSAEAKTMLKNLSGKKQTVYTAVCIFVEGKSYPMIDATDVYFKKLSDQEIDEYIETGEWIGKAGAYAIQGIAGKFIDHIDGDKENVIGLPVYMVKVFLDKFNNL